jgi:hypothetical protein
MFTVFAASSQPDLLPGVLCFAGGMFFMLRYHYFPEKFSAKLRPRTVYIMGTLLIVIGFLLMFWDLIWRLLFGSDVPAIRQV